MCISSICSCTWACSSRTGKFYAMICSLRLVRWGFSMIIHWRWKRCLSGATQLSDGKIKNLTSLIHRKALNIVRLMFISHYTNWSHSRQKSQNVIQHCIRSSFIEPVPWPPIWAQNLTDLSWQSKGKWSKGRSKLHQSGALWTEIIRKGILHFSVSPTTRLICSSVCLSRLPLLLKERATKRTGFNMAWIHRIYLFLKLYGQEQNASAGL